MKKLIDNLKDQPEEVRRHVLHIVMVAVVIMLGALWILSLGRSFSESSTKENIKKDLQPFTTLTNDLAESY